MDAHSRQLNHQVFINFRGDDVRYGFLSHLVDALQKEGINFFIDEHEEIGENLSNLFVRIEESTIALVIFSRMYTESIWCLDELATIKKRADQGLLKIIPIFFKVKPATVKRLMGEFGRQFTDRVKEYRYDEERTKSWKEALASVSCKIGLTFANKSNENKFVKKIVKVAKKMIQGNLGGRPTSGGIRDTASLGVQRSSPVSTQESVISLVQANSNIANQVAVVSKCYAAINSENKVLTAQLSELTARLQSLNCITEVVEGETRECPDFLMKPWQLPCPMMQSISGSADMFCY